MPPAESSYSLFLLLTCSVPLLFLIQQRAVTCRAQFDTVLHRESRLVVIYPIELTKLQLG